MSEMISTLCGAMRKSPFAVCLQVLSLETFYGKCKAAQHLQLPNLRGHAWASIGKSSKCIGHSALTVSLRHKREGGIQYLDPLTVN